MVGMTTMTLEEAEMVSEMDSEVQVTTKEIQPVILVLYCRM